jgi:hypothetical protein
MVVLKVMHEAIFMVAENSMREQVGRNRLLVIINFCCEKIQCIDE